MEDPQTPALTGRRRHRDGPLPRPSAEKVI
jgi:hypothetical protein